MIFYHFLFKNKLTAKHIQTLLITLFNSLSLGDDKKFFFFFFFWYKWDTNLKSLI